MSAELQRVVIESEYRRVVEEAQEITADDVAKVLGVSRQSASKMLWRMVEQGILEARTRRGLAGRPATLYKLIGE